MNQLYILVLAMESCYYGCGVLLLSSGVSLWISKDNARLELML